ncbi:MAG TPA: TolC family protein [Gemmataceae bacterium]|nr:TolC family protein [Gemmataceae bacterium]
MGRLGCLAVFWMAAMAQLAVAAPPTLDHAGKKCRFISLAEARAIALGQGTVGQPFLLFPGIGLDSSLAIPQAEPSKPVRVVCKPRSKCLLLTGVSRHPRPAEFERNVNQMLLNVENAYWNLYGSYWQLHSREQALRLAYETWKITATQLRDGRIRNAAVAQAEEQYNLFRNQRLQALDNVRDNERQLRAMMGIQIEDETRLVPSDAPTVVEKKPDWEEARRHALKHRPELRLARQDIKLAARKVAVTEEASEDVPQIAETPQAELQLKRARLVLKDQKLKTDRFLGLYYRRMSSAYFQIESARAQREAFGIQVRLRQELYRTGANEPGTDAPVTLSLLLESQRFWADALATEYQAIVTYNNAIAGWEYAKGDIMNHAHVRFAKEPPAGSKSVRAVEREHKQTRRKVSLSRSAAAEMTFSLAVLHQEGVDLETCYWECRDSAPDLPALWTCISPLKEAGDVEFRLVEWKASDIFPPRRVHSKAKR